MIRCSALQLLEEDLSTLAMVLLCLISVTVKRLFLFFWVMNHLNFATVAVTTKGISLVRNGTESEEIALETQ